MACFKICIRSRRNDGLYSLQSLATGASDDLVNKALLVTFATNAAGDSDLSGETISCSRFPVGFHDKVLFAGRAFPKHDFEEDAYSGEGGLSNHGKYATSFTNYVNVALMSLCFQMFAETKDVFDLLDMVRSTCLTDYISTGETVSLEKGYYNGVLFSIPGAEVKINDEWVAFDNKNKDKILAQNPMNLEWRLNGDLLRKMGYTSGQTVEGQVITVDDKWGGLRLEIPMTIKIQ